MNSSKFRFVLDLHSTQSQISIPVTKGDTARVWYISLSDGGLPYIIEDGCLAKIEIKRPTGTFLEVFCPIENNTTIKYDFSQDDKTIYTAAVEGVHDCSVTIYDAEYNQVCSPKYSMVVSDRVVNSDDINLSDDDVRAIDAMMASEASRQEAEIGRVNAEAVRQANEAARVAAEEARASSESQRVTDEAARQTAMEEALTRIDTKLAGVDLTNYYTKKETDAKIAEAITTTLNTEV